MQSLKALKGRYVDGPITSKEAQHARDELKALVLKNCSAKKD